jgi:hypothetical protein
VFGTGYCKLEKEEGISGKYSQAWEFLNDQCLDQTVQSLDSHALKWSM